MTNNSATVLRQRLAEKLSSGNPEETENGVQTLVEYILKSDNSSKESKAEKLIPPSETLSKVLRDF